MSARRETHRAAEATHQRAAELPGRARRARARAGRCATPRARVRRRRRRRGRVAQRAGRARSRRARSSTVRSRSEAVSACRTLELPPVLLGGGAGRLERRLHRRSRSPAVAAAATLASNGGASAPPATGISRRRWRISSAAVSAGTETGSPVSSHVPSSRRTSWPSRARSASAVETVGRRAPTSSPISRCESTSGTAMPSRDDPAPALGEMPEEREQAAVHPVELRDRLRDGEALRPLGQPVDDHRADLGIARRARRPSGGRSARGGSATARSSGSSTASSCGGPSMCQGRTMSPGPSSSVLTVSPSTTSRASTPSAISSPRCAGSASARRAPSHSPTGERRDPHAELAFGRRAPILGQELPEVGIELQQAATRRTRGCAGTRARPSHGHRKAMPRGRGD